MSKVILQPAGDGAAKAHYVDTIQNFVPLADIQTFVSADVFGRLKSLFLDGKVAVWGVTPGEKEINRHKWEKVQSGDVVLFSRNKFIFASATVAFTTHNKELALHLWKNNDKGNTWEYIYFLDEVEEQRIPYSKFNAVAGYKENFVIQGFNVLDENKSNNVLTSLALQSDTYYPEVSKEDYFKSISEPAVEQPLDKIRQGTVRTEQAFLRSVHFHSKTALCGICGKEYPVNFLVAAHIKKRADCTEEERRDYQHITMPMCKFGCDDLYEKGYIFVDEGRVVLSKNKYVTSAIQAYIKEIIGNNCPYWSPKTEKYFQWHKDIHGED
jgi:hypothetical protein